MKDSRPVYGGAVLRRRRVCPGCGARWTTFEVEFPESADHHVTSLVQPGAVMIFDDLFRLQPVRGGDCLRRSLSTIVTSGMDALKALGAIAP